MKARVGISVLALMLVVAPASAAVFDDMTFMTDGNGALTDFSNPDAFYELSFMMRGSDNGTLFSLTSYTGAPQDKPLIISGDYAYLSEDSLGPFFDPFGYIVDGELFQLTDDLGLNAQTGSFAFTVMPDQRFGWYIEGTDDINGPGSVSVGANATVVPIPAALPLLATALGGLFFLRHRRAA